MVEFSSYPHFVESTLRRPRQPTLVVSTFFWNLIFLEIRRTQPWSLPKKISRLKHWSHQLNSTPESQVHLPCTNKLTIIFTIIYISKHAPNLIDTSNFTKQVQPRCQMVPFNQEEGKCQQLLEYSGSLTMQILYWGLWQQQWGAAQKPMDFHIHSPSCLPVQ